MSEKMVTIYIDEYLFQNCTTEYRFRCIKREFHEAKRFALLEVKYPV